MRSLLTNYEKVSPNKSVRKNSTYNPTGKIDAIVIHHVAGKTDVESLGALFAQESRQASSNYGIGNDGRIGCYAPEEYRSWCSGDRGIDYRAITIEVSNCAGEPDWPVSKAAFESLIKLCADICKRYGFRLNYTGDKTGNLHMHKWYQATDCPGPYLERRFADIAAEVNRRLDGEEKRDVFYRVQVGAFNKRENADAMLQRLLNDGYEGFIVEVERN